MDQRNVTDAQTEAMSLIEQMLKQKVSGCRPLTGDRVLVIFVFGEDENSFDDACALVRGGGLADDVSSLLNNHGVPAAVSKQNVSWAYHPDGASKNVQLEIVVSLLRRVDMRGRV